MKRVLSLLFIVMAVLVVAACGPSEVEDTRDTLTVGLEADYPPFNWLDTVSNDTNYPLDGHRGHFVDGYDVQMAKHIADELDLRLVIKMIDWDSLIFALNAGEIDLIIAGMSPTEDRLLEIDFTDVYYTSNHVALVMANGPLANITSVDELSGYTGVGQTNTTYEEIVDWLGENHEVNVLNSIDTVPNIVLTIRGGDAHFTIVERPVAQGLMSRYSDLKMVLDRPFEENIFEVEDTDRIVSIGISKNKTDLKNRINAVLSNISLAQREQWMNDAVTRAE